MHSSKVTKNTKDAIKTSILVVDDESGIRNLLMTFLSAEFMVSLASSADEAIGLLEKDMFDIVISDINMPGMSGKEFFGTCRKQYPEMQFILMTGRPEFAYAIESVKDGAFYYLLKPLDLKLLHSLLLKAAQEKKSSSGTGSYDAGIIKNLGSRYKIVRSLGSGASGVVLLVENDGKQYAMKLLRVEKASENYSVTMERFIREAKILMRIKNEHVVKIVEHNLAKTNENPYIIMEYVKGMPLSGHIKENKLSIQQKISMIQQIAETLASVHGHGVLHRDIKPDNILVTDDLLVKITDFGICHVPDSLLTMLDQALGSPEYMAPECFDGSGKKPELKADIFSLGVVSYELLTGTRPFMADTVCQVVIMLKEKKPIAPVKLNPEIPLWLQAVLAKMLDKNPERRFGNCGEISKVIEHHLVNGGKMDLRLTARLIRSFIPGANVWS